MGHGQRHQRKSARRSATTGHLPGHETTLSPGDSCGECGGDLKTLGEDLTEELEYIPGRFVVNRILRPRMTCTCCETFHQADLPWRPFERGRPKMHCPRYCLRGTLSLGHISRRPGLKSGSAIAAVITRNRDYVQRDPPTHGYGL